MDRSMGRIFGNHWMGKKRASTQKNRRKWHTKNCICFHEIHLFIIGLFPLRLPSVSVNGRQSWHSNFINLPRKINETFVFVGIVPMNFLWHYRSKCNFFLSFKCIFFCRVSRRWTESCSCYSISMQTQQWFASISDIVNAIVD